MGEPVLSARGVRKIYRTAAHEVLALRGVDVELAPGELVTVMGPSGCGKTTLLNCLSGLDAIDGGQVLVDGVDIHALADGARTRLRARRMGFVFQTFNLVPVLSALENVELPLLVNRLRAREARRRASEILERIGLGDRLGHRPAELSGGEQQRVAIARALVAQPAIVWADEPTGNLDSETASQVLELLLELHAGGQTFLVVTHDRTIAERGDRVLHLRDGRIVDGGGSDP